MANYEISEDWLIMKDISDKDEQNQFIKTGIHSLDNTTQGLILGATSIWTGTNGSNKSGTIGQIGLNVVNSKQSSVAYFSGELPDKRFKRWLYLQCAGKLHNKQKKDIYGNETEFYETPQNVKEQITDWLGNKLYLYNNKKGFSVESVGNSIVKLIRADKNVKLIFIDNLFVLGIGKLASDKYEAQKELLLKMTRVAQEYNIHIAFICHPTKNKTMIRKEDVSGSSDITNVADNVFICHRNTADFKYRSKEYFGWDDSNPIYDFDNLIEIAKDRENGAIEKFIGVYYEKESKRILNKRSEYFEYGWEKKQSIIDFTAIDDEEVMPY